MGSANYVLIETDLALDPAAKSATSKEAAKSDLTKNAAATGFGSQNYVRRPTRGIQIKREVFAVLTVTGADALVNSSLAPQDKTTNFTSNFLLQSIQESRQEKFQPITTFGAPYGFFFGEQPRMVSCSALLLNTADFQWEAEWWTNYDQNMRGTRLVDKGARVTLTYEDVLIEGYMVQASTSKSEPNPWVVNLQFTLWVTSVTYLIAVGAPSIDTFHDQKNLTSEWTEFDSDGTLDGPTMLEDVRARNIAALSAGSGSGLIDAVSNMADGFNSFMNKVGNALDNAKDWLYGRNMVIPMGFAGSEHMAGFAEFAEGTGAVMLTISGSKVSISQGSVTLRAPVRVASKIPAKGNFYDDNIDEYVARGVSGKVGARQEEVDTVLVDKTNKHWTDPSVAYAEAMFANFGIDVMNDKGAGSTAVMQVAGRIAFAALSYAASGVDAQDAAALIATGSSPGFVLAAGETALAGALA